ncbi:RDD family protein [Cellulomonas aerilata]|uniref:RDD domain-containing protein n=1 Tax=Cellulomonas aerilata TaxID=515326 RepID=A0A512D7Q4_9CELL|nr:RDD family protein [Cellulomonas aerilata]GEO32518.1 hypothetical protein CAE01nite_02430 [Cellulomonas aerilata]
MTVDGWSARTADAPHGGDLGGGEPSGGERRDDPPAELLASWTRRVLATLLDHALLATVFFLVFPVQPVAVPSLAITGDQLDGTVPVSWWSNGWAVGAVVLGLALQAYLGSTPGKLVLGVAVVRRADARPAGLLLTVARQLAHVLDAVLLIGYLRPLWHRRRQTFADSLAGTVALATRRPRPFRLGGSGDRSLPPGTPAWEVSREPRWRRAVVGVATAACAVALAFQVSSTTTSSGPEHRTCSVPTAGAFTGGEVEVHRATGTVRRLWVERPQRAADPGVVVAWHLQDGAAAGRTRAPGSADTVLRVTLAAADGTPSRTVERTVVEGQVQATGEVLSEGQVAVPDEVLVDGRTGIRLPLAVVADLGDDWTAELSVVTGGQRSGRCTVR